MVIYISLVLGVLLLWFSFRSLFQPGFALAMIWSMYASEQLLQQGHVVFLQLGSLSNFFFTFVCLAAVLLALQQGKYRGWRITPEALFCGSLFALAALSYFWSVSPEDTSQWYTTGLPYLVAFMLVAPLCATDQKQLQLAIDTTVFLGGIVMLGHAFSSHAGFRAITFSVGGDDLIANPLAVASYAGYVGICSLFSIYGRKFSPLIALKFAILLLAAFVIFKSRTRGQLIALVLVCFIWLPVIARATLKRSTIIALAGSAIIVCGSIYAFNNYVSGTGRWRAERLEVATEGRMDVTVDLLKYWFDQGPLTWMVGTGSSSSYKICGIYPHNVPAEVLGEEGLVGFGLLAAFCISVLRRSGKTMFSPNLKPQARVNLGILLALFCFEGLLTLKQGSMLGSVGWFGMGVTIGWLVSRLNVEARRKSRRQNISKHAYLQMQFPSPVER